MKGMRLNPFDRLAGIRWGTILGGSMLLIFAGSAGKALSSSPEARDAIRVGLLTLIALLLTTRYLAGLRGAWERVARARRARRGRLQALLATQPAEVAALLGQGLRILRRGATRAQTVRLRPASHLEFGFLKRSNYELMAMAMVFSLIVEAPIVSLVCVKVTEDAATARLLEFILLGATLLSLCLVLRALWAMRQRPHVLTRGGIKFRLGAKLRLNCPYPLVGSAQVGEPPAREPDASTLCRASPMERGNVRIQLNRPLYVHDQLRWVDRIDIQVDEPDAFVRALNERRGAAVNAA